MPAELKATEAEKYRCYWTIPGERNVSPAMRGIEAFAEEARKRGVERVLDIGCGMGRSLAWLLEHGFDAIGTDIAENCLNDDLKVALAERFICAPAWDLPFEADAFDCVHCVDVLEHVPPELVDETLAELARVAPLAYLEPATFDRSVYAPGHRAPLKVHLTVEDNEWWVRRAVKFYDCVYWRRREPPKTQGVEMWASRSQ